MTNKRATIKDVAAKAGVGISIVSYVLNDTPGKSVSAFDSLISGQNPQEIETTVQTVEVAECIRKRLPEYRL